MRGKRRKSVWQGLLRGRFSKMKSRYKIEYCRAWSPHICNHFQADSPDTDCMGCVSIPKPNIGIFPGIRHTLRLWRRSCERIESDCLSWPIFSLKISFQFAQSDIVLGRILHVPFTSHAHINDCLNHRCWQLMVFASSSYS